MAALAPSSDTPQFSTKPEPTPSQILAVKNVLSEYCFTLDAKQYERLAKLFCPDSICYYGAVAPNSDINASSPVIGREAVISFLHGRTHDKTTIHQLSTQYLDFEFHDDGTAAACIAKTYFTANTFSLPTVEGGNMVHTVVYGMYLDILWPRDDEDKPGNTIWGIYHRRVKILVPRLVMSSQLAIGPHEEVEQQMSRWTNEDML